MNAAIFNKPISELHRLVDVIAQNLTYIMNELQTLTLSEDVKNEILVVCQAFRLTLSDVNKEVRNLEHKLGMHSDDEPFDSIIVNPDPRVAIDLINHLITREVEAMHRLVVKLRALASLDSSRILVGVEVLVTESAANILNAYRDIKKQFSFIIEHLGKIDSV
jgi:hypothetical protein